jgi:FkbM family methyltransferase
MASDLPADGAAPRLDDLLDVDRALEPNVVCYGLRQCRHGPMLFNRRDIFIGRSLGAYGEFSEGEIIVLSQLLRPGAVIVEAGSNVGAHTVPLARLAGPSGFVYAFEPQRLIFQILCANLALNALANVSARCEALGRATGTAHVPQLRVDIEQNFGGVEIEHQTAGEKMPVSTIDSLGLKRLSLVKADVEGMEQAVLEGGREAIERLRPILYLENDRRGHSPALIRLVQSLGYRAWWHVVSIFNSENFAGSRANIFGAFASVNLLALPAERRATVDLKPVVDPDDWPIATRSSSG